MVADALEVFCYHQKIQRVLRVAAAGADHFDKRGFHAQKAIVNHVVVLDDASCKGKVALIIRLDAVGDHADGGLGHGAHGGALAAGLAAEMRNYLGNIACLIADALKVGYHFKRGRYLPQVARHGLLLEQKPQAQSFNIALVPVDLKIKRRELFCKLRVAREQRLCRVGYRLLAHCAHKRELFAKLPELGIEFASHQPNLPVI